MFVIVQLYKFGNKISIPRLDQAKGVSHKIP